MATRSISTKLAIDGESEYRASLSRINTELKTLQSELRLTESRYQTNANSMEALSAKGEALANLYKAQQQKVESLKSALDNAKKAEEEYASQKAALISQIEENNKKLEALKNTTGDTSKEEKALTEENKALNEQLDKCDANLTATEKGVNSWQTQLNNAEIKLNDLDAEIKLNNEYLEEAKNSADGCATSIDRFGERVQASADQASELKEALVSAGVIAALEKTIEAFDACVGSASNFEYTMSSVAAISSASSEDMDKLNVKAKEIGAGTMYTAQQAGEALSYMALAGWDAQEMLSGVDGVISLAAASGEDLGRVSDIVTDALTAFGLSAKDSGHFVDILAAAASNSNTTVSMLGEAFKYAAPVAGALGYTVEDVAVAMGLMANNGIKGSTAGTTLRNVFSALTGEIRLSSSAFGEVTLTAQNSDGTMESFSGTLNKLKGYFGQMTEAEKVNNAQALVGTRAYAGLLAILNTTEDDYQSLASAIENCTGAAKTMADTRMDNLTGQVTLMESAFDAVKISIGEKLTPVLERLASAATDGLSWLADTIEQSDVLVPVITAVAVGIGVLSAAVVGYTAVTKLAAAATKLFDAALEANPIFLTVSAVAALVAGLAALVSFIGDNATPSIERFDTAARGLADSISEIQTNYKDQATALESTALQAQSYVDVLEKMEEAGLDSAESQEAYRRTVEKLNLIMPELNLTIDEQTGLINGGTQAIRGQIEAWRDMAIQEALMGQYKDILAEVAAVEAEQYENRVRLSQAEAEHAAMLDEYAEKQNRVAEIQAQMNELIESGAGGSETYRALSNECEALTHEMEALNDSLILNESNQELLKEDIEAGTAAVEEQQGAIDQASEALRLFNEEQQAAAESSENFTDATRDNEEAVAGITDDLASLAESYAAAYDAAGKSIEGQIGLFGDFTASLSSDLDTAEELLHRWGEQTEALGKYTENLQWAAQSGLDLGLVKSLADGSAESAAYLQLIRDEVEQSGTTIDDLGNITNAGIAKFNSAWYGTAEARETLQATMAGIEVDLNTSLATMEEKAAEVDFDGFQTAFKTAFQNVGLDATNIGADFGSGIAVGIKNSTGDVETSGRGMADALEDGCKSELGIASPSTVGIEIGQNFDVGVETGVKDGAEGVVSAAQTMADDVISTTESGAEAAVTAFDTEFRKITGKTQASIAELRSAVNSGMSGMPNDSYNVGQQTINGMINGMNNRAGTLYWTVSSIVNKAIASARSAAAVASPSKKTTEIFEFVGEGMIVGIENRRKALEDKMQSVVDSALQVDVKNNLAEKATGIDARQVSVSAGESKHDPKALGADNRSITMQNTINVYAKDGQDAREIADEVARLLNDGLERVERAWA